MSGSVHILKALFEDTKNSHRIDTLLLEVSCALAPQIVLQHVERLECVEPRSTSECHLVALKFVAVNGLRFLLQSSEVVLPVRELR